MSNFKEIVASLSSAPPATGEINGQPVFLINLQLDSWIEAKQKYYNLINCNNYSWGSAIQVIAKLGESLTYLFGANYSANGKTPYLKNYIDSVLPSQNNWNLKKDDPELYKDFKRLDLVHKDLSKHFAKSKIPKCQKITIDDLKKHMETTQRVWLWFLKKKCNNNVPEELLTHFKEKFV